MRVVPATFCRRIVGGGVGGADDARVASSTISTTSKGVTGVASGVAVLERLGVERRVAARGGGDGVAALLEVPNIVFSCEAT